MSNFNDNDIEIIEDLQEILIRHATGGESNDTDEYEYKRLRRFFLTDEETKNSVPDFIRESRDLGAFWAFIKPKFSTYKERRSFIYTELSKLFDIVEGINTSQTSSSAPEIHNNETNNVISAGGNINAGGDIVFGDNDVLNHSGEKFNHKSEAMKTAYWIIGSIIVLLIIFLIYYFTGMDISMQK